MRIPNIRSYSNDQPEELIELDELDIPRSFYNLSNKKDRDKYIKTVEKLVRQSIEYKDLITFLKTKMGMNFCSFFHHVSKDIYGKANFTIEIHHEPFTLYDIVAVILTNREMDKEDWEPIDMYDVAEEVMEMHYKGYIGLIPLSKTVHELVHSGKLFIPLQFIDDGFNTFYQTYHTAINSMDGLAGVLEAKVNLSKDFEANPMKFMSILQKKYVYVLNSGYDSIPEKIQV